jgi:NAD(P)-dependent dehydrogenase (short-subunit alcohol dehydrogenase family)
MLLENRVALVTGAGRGIGREFALSLAREGAAVVVNDIGASLDGRAAEGDPAAEVCKEIEALGGRAVPAYGSVADDDDAKASVETAVKEFGRLDILVNNAGIIRDKTLLKMEPADFDAVVAVHLRGTFCMTRHAAAVMREQEYGRIINMSSSAGLRGNVGQTNYGAAKAGIMGMTFVWALELSRYNITVNAMAPSGTTRMTMGLYERTGATPPADQEPHLNAPLVAYLASEHAGHVSGQVFGRTSWGFTIFQTPRQVATMWQEGGWTPEQVAENFDSILGQHLQPVGMPPPVGQKFEKKDG